MPKLSQMISIVKPTIEDSQLLADIGRISFIESHGRSGSTEDINMYVNEKFNKEIFKEELTNPKNIYYIIYHEKKPAGYSKINLNCPHPDIQIKNVTKLDRLYLLKEFYSLKLGLELLKFNIEFSKNKGQIGMWLFTWKENVRAVNFYKKNGFEIIGSHDFKLTDSHSNPNHHMFLKY